MTVFLMACSPSTEDLTKQVQQSMNEKFQGTGIIIDSLTLTKKGGNEYTGVLETKEPDGDFTYRVNVVSDGESFTWQTMQ